MSLIIPCFRQNPSRAHLRGGQSAFIPTAAGCKRMKQHFGLLLLFALAPLLLLAQTGATTRQASATTQRRDSIPLLFNLALSPEKSYPDADTLPDASFRMYDPVRKQAIDWGHLGHVGSPARPLLFEPDGRRGFDAGFHAFDLHRMAATDLRFYRYARSVSDVFFSQGGNQFDGMLNARFGRTFSDGSCFALDYRTVNNKGQFRHLRSKHNTLMLGVWVPIGKRYDGFIIAGNNINRQQDNGGLVSDTIGDALVGAIDAEVRLGQASALTRFSDQTVQLVQHLRFVGGDDGKRALRATHTFSWMRERYKFYDDQVSETADYYGNFYTDARGLRQYLSLNRYNNTFSITTYKEKARGRPSDVLTVGIDHTFFDIYQEPRDTSLSNLFATGSLAVTPSDRFAFLVKGELGVPPFNTGEYRLSGELALGLGKAGRLRGGVQSQRFPPALIQHQLFVSQRSVWLNNFEKPIENTLWASYALPLIGLEASARTHVVNNYIYYNTLAQPVQLGTPVSVLQLLVSENLRIGPIHLDNTIALQQSGQLDGVLRLPAWFTKNSVYYSGKVFKKRLFVQTGFDFRMNAEFRPDAYFPVNSQFHLQDSLTQKPYPWLDFFAAIKVSSFRFFFRWENLNGLIDQKTFFYNTAYNPQPLSGIRLGISWRFLDANLKEQDPAKQGDDNSGNGTQSNPLGPFGSPRRGNN